MNQTIDKKPRPLKVKIIAWTITLITIGTFSLPFIGAGILIGWLIWG